MFWLNELSLLFSRTTMLASRHLRREMTRFINNNLYSKLHLGDVQSGCLCSCSSVVRDEIPPTTSLGAGVCTGSNPFSRGEVTNILSSPTSLSFTTNWAIVFGCLVESFVFVFVFR